jgi:RhoGEF domain
MRFSCRHGIFATSTLTRVRCLCALLPVLPCLSSLVCPLSSLVSRLSSLIYFLCLSDFCDLHNHLFYPPLPSPPVSWIPCLCIHSEFVSSEETYVSHLSNFVTYFLEPLQNNRYDVHQTLVTQISSNFAGLVEFHKRLLADLQVVTPDQKRPASNIAAVFVTHGAEMEQLYCAFAASYGSGVQAVESLEDNADFQVRRAIDLMLGLLACLVYILVFLIMFIVLSCLVLCCVVLSVSVS